MIRVRTFFAELIRLSLSNLAYMLLLASKRNKIRVRTLMSSGKVFTDLLGSGGMRLTCAMEVAARKIKSKGSSFFK